MRKTLSLLIAFTLILALAACGQTAAPDEPEATAAPAATTEPVQEPTQEPTQEPAAENWYGQSRGMAVTLTLLSDGTYTMELAGETKVGTWQEEGGEITLDANGEASFLRLGDTLCWIGMGINLASEEPTYGVYVPAELLTDVPAETFNGYWTSIYVDAEGNLLPASEVRDVTDIYIEAPRAALGGPLFGDVVVDMTFSDGTLSWAEGDVSVLFQLQEDGILRATLGAPGGDMVLYLAPTYAEALDGPAEEEAP